MIRRLLPAAGALAAAALLSTGLSSCKTVDRADVAAEVNGNQLTNEQLSKLADGSTDAAVLRETLAGWIQVASLSDDASDITDTAALDKTRTDVLTGLLDQLGEPGRAAYETGLAGEYTCLAVIPLDAAVPAADVITEILGGLSFADAAAKYSTAQSLAASGGVIADQNGQGCFNRADFDAKFASVRDALQSVDAEVGVPNVISDGGGEYVVLLRPYDELNVSERVTVGQTELAGAIASAYDSAKVWVNPHLGVWNVVDGTVGSLTDGTGS